MKSSELFLTLGNAFRLPVSLLTAPANPFFSGKHRRTPARNKCRTHGHLYRNMGTTHDKNGKLYMAGECKRCGQAYGLIPARRAESNLHPAATRKSIKHWLRPHIIGGWVYAGGKPQQPANAQKKEQAA